LAKKYNVRESFISSGAAMFELVHHVGA